MAMNSASMRNKEKELVKIMTPIVAALQNSPGSSEVKLLALDELGREVMASVMNRNNNATKKNKAGGVRNNVKLVNLKKQGMTCLGGGAAAVAELYKKKGMDILQGEAEFSSVSSISSQEIAKAFVEGALKGLAGDVCIRVYKKFELNKKANSLANSIKEKIGLNVRIFRGMKKFANNFENISNTFKNHKQKNKQIANLQKRINVLEAQLEAQSKPLNRREQINNGRVSPVTSDPGNND